MDTPNKYLKENGYRITNARQEIYSALTRYPQSVNEISILLKNKNIKIDLVTIYRTLDFYTSLGLIEKSLVDEKNIKYELKTGSIHHHHLVCEQCGKLEDLPISDAFLINKVEKGTNFTIRRHVLEFYGVCAKCKGVTEN